MSLLDTNFGNSYSKDLTQIKSLCGNAILNCEKIRPCHKKDKTHISTADIQSMELYINVIIQKTQEAELHWKIKFNTKLSTFDSMVRQRDDNMVALRDKLLKDHFPAKHKFAADNAMLDSTEKQISSLLKEVNHKLHDTPHTYVSTQLCKIEEIDSEATELSNTETSDWLIPF